MRGRPVRGLGLAVVIGLLLAACGASFSDPEVREAARRVSGAMEQQARMAQQTQPVGGTITTTSGELLTLERVRGEVEGARAAEGERLVVLDIAISNPTSEPLPLNEPQNFWISELSGRRYEPTERRNLPATVAAGAQARATLVFSVAADGQALRFGWQRHPLTVFELP